MVYDRALRSYRKTRVETSDPLKLVIMCYDEAIQSIRQAKMCYEEKNFEGKAKHLTRAQEIIGELLGSLDKDKGGVIASNLGNLYNYMLRRLMQGDLDKELTAFDEVVGLLADLLDAWEQVARKGEAKAQLGKRYNRVVMTPRGVTA